jgi:hypothetical protein
MFRYRYEIIILGGGEVAFYLKELLYILFTVWGWVAIRRLRWEPYMFMVTVVTYLGYIWHLWNMSMTANLLSNKCEGGFDYLFGNCLYGVGDDLNYGGIYGWLWLPFGVMMMGFLAVIWLGGGHEGEKNNIMKIDWLVIVAIITLYSGGWWW